MIELLRKVINTPHIYYIVSIVMTVEVDYFSDKRLKMLLRCRVGDKNFWHDSATNSYTICLDEDTISLLFETYLALNNYNNWKLRKKYGLS